MAGKKSSTKGTEVDSLQRRALRILKGTAKFEDRYFPDHKKLIDQISILRSMGCIIVFTTGVWDLFHIGHGEYIHRGKEGAKELYPDAEHVIMVVGFDTDEMTRSRKGPLRPAVPEDERAGVLGYIRSVDIITPQYKPDQLFRVVHHDVRVISQSTKDLPVLKMIQAECEHIVNLPPQAEISTTARLRRIMLTGGHDVLERISPKLVEAVKSLTEVAKEVAVVRKEIQNAEKA